MLLFNDCHLILQQLLLSDINANACAPEGS
jgi:hypothetical protein